MNVCIGSVVEGETEAHRGEPSGLVAHAGRILSLPSAQGLLCHSFMDWGRGEAGESSLFLLSISLTFSADWAAPLEVVCPQIGATGPDWGGGLRGAGTRPASSRHPGWSCTIVLSWPTTQRVMTLTRGTPGSLRICGGAPGASTAPTASAMASSPFRTEEDSEGPELRKATPHVQASPTRPWRSPRRTVCSLQLPRGVCPSGETESPGSHPRAPKQR